MLESNSSELSAVPRASSDDVTRGSGHAVDPGVAGPRRAGTMAAPGTGRREEIVISDGVGADPQPARLREILDPLRLLAVQLDLAGHATYCNQFVLEVTGWPREEALEHDWSSHLVPQDMPRPASLVEAVVRGELPRHHQGVVPGRGGESRVVAWDITVLREPAGSAVGLLCLGRDVTEETRLSAQLHQTLKMETVGQLAGGVAHDFNNLLTAIRLNCQLLLRSPDVRDQAREDVREISRVADRAAALTRQLLAFSRKELPQPELLDLNVLIADMHGILRRLLSEDIDVVVQLSPGLGLVRADPGQVEQVVLNLALNARDAMPGGGVLRIETANAMGSDADACAGTAFPACGCVVLTVADSGVGMSPAVRARAFEPFFTTKAPGRGTGIGLSAVQGIVNGSKGCIAVESEPGRGSTFRIFLPRAEGCGDGSTGAAQAAATADDDASADGLRAESPGRSPAPSTEQVILLVEDQQELRQPIARVLREAGYSVLTAASAADALVICEQPGATLDLLITDLVMPGMSGRALAERVVACHPNARTLLISGYPEDEVARRGLVTPGAPFLAKPFTTGELIEKVREVLGRPAPRA